MRVPRSISEAVFYMRHPILWTLAIELAVVTAMVGMLEVSDSAIIPAGELAGVVAFLSCVCVGFVGVMPLFLTGRREWHYRLASIGAVLSQLWVILMFGDSNVGLIVLIAWWVLMLQIMKDMKDWWCLIAEIGCIVSVGFTVVCCL